MSLNDPNWGRGSRGPGGNQGPPDLDELWRNFNRKLNDLFGGRRGGGGDIPPASPSGRMLGGGAGVLLALVLAIWLASGFYVVDSASPARGQQAAAVNKVLAEINAGEIPQIQVWNKTDLSGLQPGVERDECGRIARVFVSARSGAGLADLRGAIAEAARARQPRTPSPEPISL